MLGVSPKYQRMGIASMLMKHVFTFPEYKHYVSKVADTNPACLDLCRKIGYKEMYRKKFIPNSGINYWIHIKYSKE
jgi:ribosomal protein S18 acetylase RimI-like enzyme